MALPKPRGAQGAFGFVQPPDERRVRGPGDAGPLRLVPPQQEQRTLGDDFDVSVVRVRKLPKPRSIFAGQPLAKEELAFRTQAAEIHSQHERPKTLADCRKGGFNEMRPCPWVSCEFHLAIDVIQQDIEGQKTESIKLNFPDTGIGGSLTTDYIDWDSMDHTCLLDLIDPDKTESPNGVGLTTAEVGEALNCVESNIQRIEHGYLKKLRPHMEELQGE